MAESHQSEVAEQAIVSSILLSPDLMEYASSRLEAKDFSIPRFQVIYEAFLSLRQQGMSCDLVNTWQELETKKKLDRAGGPHYLSHLFETAIYSAYFDEYINKVERSSHRRQLIQVLETLNEKAHSPETPWEDIQDEAERSFQDFISRTVGDNIVFVGDLLGNILDDIEQKEGCTNLQTGILTGYYDLDEMTGGLQEGQLIVLAGRPGMGKTAFALNLMLNIVEKYQNEEKPIPAHIFSMEMSKESLMRRLLAIKSGIPSNRIRDGRINDGEWEKLSKAIADLSELYVSIDEQPSPSISTIRSKCRQIASKYGPPVILVDYLQLMTDDTKRSDNRTNELSRISRALKTLAIELKTPVIALSQLSRGVESRNDKRPLLSDLRDSGAIEQDADVIGFLYRGAYYGDNSEGPNTVELILGKQRDAPSGTVKLLFDPPTTSFLNMAK